MEKTAFIVRQMEAGDIAGGMKLSGAEGWNQTEKDWKLFIENPSNVCMLAEHDKKIIGTTTAINYSNQVAWIGMVLVDKEYRGQGVSKSLLTAVFEKLVSCKSIKLDATVDGQRVYKKFDFKDEYLIERMVNPSLPNLPGVKGNVVPEPIQLKHIKEIAVVDEIVFGANRRQLLEFLVGQYPGTAWMLKRGNDIAGFVVGREGRKYHQIGPLVASTAMDAKILITKALETVYGLPVVVDILSDKEEMMRWLKSFGFAQQRHFIRMYKNENLFAGEPARQYLICGPEFG